MVNVERKRHGWARRKQGSRAWCESWHEEVARESSAYGSEGADLPRQDYTT